MSRHLLLFPLLCWLAACARIGPDIIQAGGNDYNIAIQSTNNEQMLLNLVRLKYRDTPYFLQVNSVSSQFRLFSGARLSGNFREQQIPESVGLSGALNFTEQPTVTYLPLQGNDFVQQLVSPITLDTIILLANSGWSIKRILRLTVQRINGISNAPTASGPTPKSAPEYEAFQEIVDLLQVMQDKGEMQIVLQTTGQGKAATLVADNDNPETSRLRNKLKLNKAGRYSLLPGFGGVTDGNSISVNTRSLLGVMYYLSHSVNVPDGDKQNGRVTVTRDASGREFDWSALTRELFQVRSSKRPEPSQAAVGTSYRGNWYYIDDADLESKTTFSLLSQLFSLQSGDAEGVTPVLTLPVGN